MSEYKAYISCDTGFFNPLEGNYKILKYTLEPCKVTQRNQHRKVSNFTISFPFIGIDDFRISISNQEIAIEEAKLFISWLSVATRRPIDLSHTRFGGMQSFGPCSIEHIDDTDRDSIVKIHHIRTDVAEGTLEHVERPIYESSIDSMSWFCIPHDFPDLSRKLYALPERKKEVFFDSCLSYQFAIINSGIIPSVSLVALVNVVESLMRDEYSSGYCEETGKACPYKRDVMKKFRAFFEKHLQYPLPDDKRRFINDVYKNRSNFVHRALLGSGPYRGPMFMGLGGGRELYDQLSTFSALVNACMINWLMRI